MIAIVPVRKDSERVTNKNIRSFANSTLLEIKINQLKRIGLFDQIIVSSDCANMLNVSRLLGVDTHTRDPKYCNANTPMKEVYKYLANEFITNDAIAYVNVTNPLLLDETINMCVESFRNADEDIISVNTVHEVRDFMWHMGNPVNYDPYNQPRSQDLPKYTALNFACNIIRTNVMKEMGIVVGMPHIEVPIDKIQALDIDDLEDFEIAETLYNKRLKGKP